MDTEKGQTLPEPAAWIVYDGDCPFCAAYVKMVRLRQSIGRVELVNARDGGPVVAEALAAGADLDQGMALKLDGRFYFGDECVHRLALLSTSSGLFNRVNARVFRSRAASRTLYPVLRAGRNVALKLLGRRKFSEG